MKKLIALLLCLVMALSLVACGSKQDDTQAPADDQQGAEETSLVDAAKAEGKLVVYGSCEEEYLAAACENFEKMYGIEVEYQRLSTGEVQAKIEEENGNPSADVWFGGTTIPTTSARPRVCSRPIRRRTPLTSPSPSTRTLTATGTASTPASLASWSTPTSSSAWVLRLLRIGPTCSSPSTRA